MIPAPTVAVNFDVKTDPKTGRQIYYCPSAYVDEIAAFGVYVVPVLPIAARKAILAGIAEDVDGFIFIGGADYPSSMFGYPSSPHEQPMSEQRAQSDSDFFQIAWLSSKPILGICGGAQLAALVNKGSLIPHLDGDSSFHHAISPMQDSMHKITVSPGRIRSIFQADELEVNSSHHQAIDPSNLPEALMVSAVAPDGTIECVERKRKGFGIFVQWHPERHPNPEHRKTLFGAFASAVKYGFNTRTAGSK